MTGLVAALCYLGVVAQPSSLLRLWSKPLPVLCLAAWLGLRTEEALGRLLAVGLVLCAVGDLLLELDLFLPGLAAFLSAHLIYAVAFFSETKRPAWLRAVPFFLYGAVVYLFLRPHLGRLALPVLVYAIAICLMMWRAAARAGASPLGPLAAWCGLAGALLFAASDTLIALDRFRGRLPGVRYPIIVLYWLGQLGIAASAIRRRT